MPQRPKESTPVAAENEMNWALKDIPGISWVIPNFLLFQSKNMHLRSNNFQQRYFIDFLFRVYKMGSVMNIPDISFKEKDMPEISQKYSDIPNPEIYLRGRDSRCQWCIYLNPQIPMHIML
jgi:hypothetical protein